MSQSDTTAKATSPLPGELPPVEPPSARFIMQLFVIPFLVVVVVVCFLLLVYGLFGKLATSGHDTREYVQAIRSANENRRWRAAYELASLLHNEPDLTHDTELAGQMAELLNEELDKPAEKIKPEVPQYLAIALGAFDLGQEEAKSHRTDRLAVLVRALGPSAPALVRAAAAESLSRIGSRDIRASSGVHKPDVVKALVIASQDKDPSVRERAAYALAYFNTPEARAALADRVADEVPAVRFNAGAALARLDDEAGLRVLREMLSPRELESTLASDLKKNPDQARRLIKAIETEALQALGGALEKGHSQILRQLRKDLEALSREGSPDVQVEARNLLQRFFNSTNAN